MKQTDPLGLKPPIRPTRLDFPEKPQSPCDVRSQGAKEITFSKPRPTGNTSGSINEPVMTLTFSGNVGPVGGSISVTATKACMEVRLNQQQWECRCGLSHPQCEDPSCRWRPVGSLNNCKGMYCVVYIYLDFDRINLQHHFKPYYGEPGGCKEDKSWDISGLAKICSGGNWVLTGPMQKFLCETVLRQGNHLLRQGKPRG